MRTSSSYDWTFLYHGEYIDNESGLYNYGYRYYDAQLGRWLSRDPIVEKGGLNLYEFCKNRPTVRVDFVGLNSDLGNGSYRDEIRGLILAQNGELKCCDEDLIRKGAHTLWIRFKSERQRAHDQHQPREEGRPEEVGGKGNYSCYNVNNTVLGALGEPIESEHTGPWKKWEQMSQDEKNIQNARRGIPKCWDCHLENRARFSHWVGMKMHLRDHWIVICVGRNSKGETVSTMGFDLWKKGSGFEDPNAEGAFRSRYPVYVDSEYDGAIHNTCNGKRK